MRSAEDRLLVAVQRLAGRSDASIARLSGIPRAMAHPKGVFRLRIFVDARHPELAETIAAAIRRVLPGNVVATQATSDGMVIPYVYSKQLPCLFPQHGPGLKHRRDIVLRGWQERIVREHADQFVRGLFLSDGCRAANRVLRNGRSYEYARYQFSNRSGDILDLCCAALDLLNIPWRRMNRDTISVARREGVEALDAFIERKR